MLQSCRQAKMLKLSRKCLYVTEFGMLRELLLFQDQKNKVSSAAVHQVELRHIHLYLFSDLSTKELLTPSRIPFQLILKSVTMVEVAQLFQNFRIDHAKCTKAWYW